MNRRRLLFTLVSARMLLTAADPWKDKRAADWSSKDATRILTNSPWAKAVSAEMEGSRMGGGSGGGMGGPGGGMGGPGGGMGGPGGGMGGPGGGMGGPGGGMEPPKFVVRWESAAPVREAAAKIEDPNGTKIQELAKEFYVISTSGGATMPGGRRGGPEGSAQRPTPDFSRMQENMIQSTSLRIKGQNAIFPAKVEVLQAGRGMTTLFLFPRSNDFPANGKEVAFETSMGPLVIRAKFSLKDMTYEGRPAL